MPEHSTNGRTALCVGGPFDGMEREKGSDELPVTAFAGAPGRRTEHGVYRYDRSANVYRWEPAPDRRTREDAEEMELEGDGAVYDGDLHGAKTGYGGAIDVYLETRDFDAALKTCRKLIRVAPDVARARFTLAFLLIGRGELEQARVELVGYADTVRGTDAADFAVPRLQLLAHATRDVTTRVLIETLIADLGGTLAAAPENAGSFDAMARWERVLDTVLRDARG